MESYSENLQNKIIAYYEAYYQSCGLKDFQERARERLLEEGGESERMKKLQITLILPFGSGQKHFIFGAGTGGLAVVLAQEYNGSVFGIEPDHQEFEIIQEKLKEQNLPPENFKQEFGEKLSFSENKFDVVHCFTVLEHVKNVKQCLEEMIRIVKSGGLIYINTPNYSYPTERHYKIVYPTFLPKFFGKIYLALRGRPTKFIDSINFLTEKKLNKILFVMPNIIFYRVYRSGKVFGIYPNQEIIIKKL
ncbi:MAG: class I SAM-dependent methyltransferase [Patescibacteria group bacterium]